MTYAGNYGHKTTMHVEISSFPPSYVSSSCCPLLSSFNITYVKIHVSSSDWLCQGPKDYIPWQWIIYNTFLKLQVKKKYKLSSLLNFSPPPPSKKNQQNNSTCTYPRADNSLNLNPLLTKNRSVTCTLLYNVSCWPNVVSISLDTVDMARTAIFMPLSNQQVVRLSGLPRG